MLESWQHPQAQGRARSMVGRQPCASSANAVFDILNCNTWLFCIDRMFVKHQDFDTPSNWSPWRIVFGMDSVLVWCDRPGGRTGAVPRRRTAVPQNLFFVIGKEIWDRTGMHMDVSHYLRLRQFLLSIGDHS